MLPDIRAVIAAMVATIGLLMIAFALVATYRVAQERHSGSLQADLAQRSRDALPAKSGERQILIIETPGPHVLAPAKIAPIGIAPTAIVAVPPAEPEAPAPVAATLTTETPSPPPAEPPIGGPLEPPALPAEREVAPVERHVAAENPSRIDSRALERAAAAKAKKARIARERKAAARRAAQARRASQQATPSFGSFGNPFGGTFTGATGQ